MANIAIKKNNNYVKVQNIYVKKNGVYQELQAIYIKNNSECKMLYNNTTYKIQ